MDERKRDKEIPDSLDATDFVLLTDAVPDAILEIRYYSTYNFIGSRVDGYEEPVALLTKEAAKALRAVSDKIAAQGYRFKIYDAYRPVRAVKHFMRWGQNPDQSMKSYFYPDMEKQDLFQRGYIDGRSSHSRGSTVDLTLVQMQSGKELDMGSPFDFFGEASHPTCDFIKGQAYENRMYLRRMMLEGGFRAINSEWWHFTLENEPFPDTYFDFPVSTRSPGTDGAEIGNGRKEATHG
ncbi:MAG: M15 family metallopeptidase [Clostridia bacterium]|nr:M15 family metallopeptidase [Clostridia bacterium]